MADSLTGFAHKLDRLASEVTGEAARARLAKLGMESKGDVADAVRADLGDLSMSNWRRSKPVDVVGRYDLEGTAAVVISPAFKARGPMRVLEQGRQAHAAGSQRRSGSYTSKKTGDVRQKYRTVSRNVGATQGKGTWGDAVQIMQHRMPRRYEALFARDLGRFLRKG